MIVSSNGVFYSRAWDALKRLAEKAQIPVVESGAMKGQFSVDTARRELRFKRLLPNVPAKSALYAELKSFIKQRHDGELPEHRRIDHKLAEASCANRGGFVSVSVKVKNNQYAYGVNRTLDLAHELFLHLRERRPEYLMENFDVPQE